MTQNRPPATPDVARSVADLRGHVRRFRAAGERVALVPTMGALHEGHLELVRQGRARAERVVVSIFVNPTQFGPNEDVDRYPRREAEDLARLAAIGADLAFLPGVAEMYPAGFATGIAVDGLMQGLCGPFRPGHFAGMVTVVAKLLLQCLPDVAMFGEKDFQQLRVVARMARDLDIPVEIVGVPTVRDADGLALSSRNAYLSADERRQAATLPKVMGEIAAALEAGAAAAGLIANGKAELARAGFGPIQYLDLVDAETLTPLDRASRPARLAVAAYLGQTRLIDNIAVAPSADPTSS